MCAWPLPDLIDRGPVSVCLPFLASRNYYTGKVICLYFNMGPESVQNSRVEGIQRLGQHRRPASRPLSLAGWLTLLTRPCDLATSSIVCKLSEVHGLSVSRADS